MGLSDKKKAFVLACSQAQRVSKEEMCVQHVNRGLEYYYVSDWYDEDRTVRSFEFGERMD
jgi:hypothetical protein